MTRGGMKHYTNPLHRKTRTTVSISILDADWLDRHKLRPTDVLAAAIARLRQNELDRLSRQIDGDVKENRTATPEAR